jgi:alanyl-tRNA synthetase
MTDRLYYLDSTLCEFDARVTALVEARVGEGATRLAAVLDRTAFYPTSGGQPCDTGWLQALPHSGAPGSAPGLRVAEVAEDEHGAIFHFLAGEAGEGGVAAVLAEGAHVRGLIDPGRRRDHVQQHSGQHVLSAAFVRLFGLHTVGFHMGAEACTIDLDAPAVAPEQLRDAQRLANEVIAEDRTVTIHFATRDEALARGLRKLPPDMGGAPLRLIEVRDFDLTACGGTHVARSSQIGCILLRGSERVKQHVRVSFVCGGRAVEAAQRDFAALSQAAAALSTHIWELPAQVGKLLEESKAGHRQAARLLEELAAYHAAELLAAAAPGAGGVRLVARAYADRDPAFLKLLARRLTAEENVVALLASTQSPPTLLFARSAALPGPDLAALLKELVAPRAGRGGGTPTLAQGGLPDPAAISPLLAEATHRLADATR